MALVYQGRVIMGRIRDANPCVLWWYDRLVGEHHMRVLANWLAVGLRLIRRVALWQIDIHALLKG